MCKKQRKISTEVADLKQKLAQSNKSIVVSNREIRLLRFVRSLTEQSRCKKFKINVFVFFVFCFFFCRYMDLTEEEKERLKGYSKVARKLKKMESIGQQNR